MAVLQRCMATPPGLQSHSHIDSGLLSLESIFRVTSQCHPQVACQISEGTGRGQQCLCVCVSVCALHACECVTRQVWLLCVLGAKHLSNFGRGGERVRLATREGGAHTV